MTTSLSSDKNAIRWVVALGVEAKAIRQKYNMKRVSRSGPFPIFKNAENCAWLTVSGVGRVNSAAATMYLHQVSDAPPWATWINVGISGHKNNIYGHLYLIDKITEDATGRVSYPGTVITTELPRAALVTVDRPLTSYNNDSLLDMEASSFFEMACKVTNQQLVLILKIAADSPAFDIDKLTEEIVGDLVSRNIERIEETADKMINLVGHEYYRLRLPDEYQGIIDRWRFSQTEQHHLERLIRRWNVIFEGKKLMPLIDRCRSGKSVLKELSVKLDSFEIDWCDV